MVMLLFGFSVSFYILLLLQVQNASKDVHIKGEVACMILEGTSTYIIKVQTDAQTNHAYCILQMPSI